MATAAATTAMACHLITGSSFTFHKFHDDYIDSSLAPHPPEPNTFCRSLRSAHSRVLQVKHVCQSCNSIENTIHVPASIGTRAFDARAQTGIAGHSLRRCIQKEEVPAMSTSPKSRGGSLQPNRIRASPNARTTYGTPYRIDVVVSGVFAPPPPPPLTTPNIPHLNKRFASVVVFVTNT